ncbi:MULTISPECIES: gamma-glutamyl-gamma-aminobutyrate hydrolase family protein [Rhodococcus]|jgi:putative glutamine amidotransferase|uniref:Gamma-glutamyl-gamma-aminobutyrate hydrolase family protein n=1 Tax=Rhodococcus jostii TaxID=132919 RepID=A0ABU4CJA8_RHOJO|nr:MULTISPECIES: gamma-glutamyl-gamma-aminobutyrate hydrolase family protein [Rhodococcus]MDI9951367.1 gamma-glutamyl-gamma-aminobutyrate hydrolase family protein [Rhodococcus sp. IEGM 1305]MDI9976817.1 gamma-glutamyl-gamma-aminobutyrate hydrolase family protein [Rhodococcus sp. IEGM 1307]MDV6283640.1 gamma-glutamyl-gamma-aminobutyrate hydrolase family protein [Rhodococcus jostii]
MSETDGHARPLIAVPGIRSASIAGLRRSGTVAADKILEAIFRAGGDPVIVPPGPGITHRLAPFDGVVLPGGADLDPATYGAERDPRTEASDPVQDEFDLTTARAVIELELPFLAICRGMQVVNVALGGTLDQHLPDSHIWHRECMHQVWMESGSAVAQAMGGNVVEVSSYHHQAVDRLGAGLQVVGRAEDGCIEVLEHESAPMLGVQWHPEDNADTAPHQQALFDATVERARLAQARRDELGHALVRTKEN